MTKDVKPVFDWANTIGDANINNRILAKVMPSLLEAKISLTDTSIIQSKEIEVSQDIYDIIKKSAEALLATEFKEEK